MRSTIARARWPNSKTQPPPQRKRKPITRSGDRGIGAKSRKSTMSESRTARAQTASVCRSCSDRVAQQRRCQFVAANRSANLSRSSKRCKTLRNSPSEASCNRVAGIKRGRRSGKSHSQLSLHAPTRMRPASQAQRVPIIALRASELLLLLLHRCLRSDASQLLILTSRSMHRQRLKSFGDLLYCVCTGACA